MAGHPAASAGAGAAGGVWALAGRTENRLATSEAAGARRKSIDNREGVRMAGSWFKKREVHPCRNGARIRIIARLSRPRQTGRL